MGLISGIKDIAGGVADIAKGGYEVGKFAVDHTVGAPLTFAGYISEATGGERGARLSELGEKAAKESFEFGVNTAKKGAEETVDLAGAAFDPFYQAGKEVGNGFVQVGNGIYRAGEAGTRGAINLSPPGMIVWGSNQIAGATGGEPGRNLDQVLLG